MKRIEVLSAARFEGSDVDHAACVKAGNWIFLTGMEATDHRTGAASSVLGKPGLPLHGLPKHRREGDLVVARIKALLELAGTSFANSVRLDQYYPTWKAVDPYHLARKAAFGDYIPPSTSVVMEELLSKEIDISASLLAVLPGGGREPQRVSPPEVTAPVWSGFASVVKSGDFVFIAGIMARGADYLPDPRAHVPPHSRWGGYEIRRQAEFIINEKLKPALEAAGSSPKKAVKAQAYLRHIDDLPHFLDVWNAHFGERQCALTIVPTSDFGLVDGNLEINLMALADNGKTKKEIITSDVPGDMTFGAPGVRAGDLLLLSGMQAVDRDGPVTGVGAGARMPHLGISERAQMTFILEQAARICAAAGTSLENFVRVHQFHDNLDHFYPMFKVWQERAGTRCHSPPSDRPRQCQFQVAPYWSTCGYMHRERNARQQQSWGWSPVSRQDVIDRFRQLGIRVAPAQVGRPCRLGWRVDKDQRIFVSGRVIAPGRDEVDDARAIGDDEWIGRRHERIRPLHGDRLQCGIA